MWQNEPLSNNTLSIALELAQPVANEQQLQTLSWFLADRQQLYGLLANQLLVATEDNDQLVINLWDSSNEYIH